MPCSGRQTLASAQPICPAATAAIEQQGKAQPRFQRRKLWPVKSAPPWRPWDN